MRLITFRHLGQQEIGALADADTKVIRLQAAEELRCGEANPHFQAMLSFLQGGGTSRDAAQQTFEFALAQRPDGIVIARENIELLSPVPRPESIREFMVFEQHVINCTRRFEMPGWRAAVDRFVEKMFGRKATLAYRKAQPWYERPVYYKGNRMNVIGDGAEVTIPLYTQKFDWELEFGIFLCKKGRDISKGKAREFIGGYTIFNDFSARDIQKREMGGRLGPAKGKDFDGGNSIGPVLVTPDEIPDPYNLTMRARINGEEVSFGHTKGMRWKFEDLIAYVSQDETLYPGEFFGSGTGTVPESGSNRCCCGLEMGRFLKAGDTIELEVEKIGKLTNRVVGQSS
ncbi:MAG TPA: fumarylacetoacetate hydrolase family protein [Candidatus Acidoferrales bacterium]|nr:fumarylacetoacetate hydrolase family protein [Candidatus Acidoferrales bacterium]